MRKVVVIGAGGFGREVIEIFNDLNKIEKNWNILGFIDETPALQGKKVNNLPVLGDLEWIKKNKNDVECVVAIGNTKGKKNRY